MNPDTHTSLNHLDPERMYRFKIWLSSKVMRPRLHKFIKTRKLSYQANDATPQSASDLFVDWHSVRLPSLYDIIPVWHLSPYEFFAELDPDYQVVSCLNSYHEEFFDV